MSVGITPVVLGRARSGGVAWALWFETLLTLALVAALLPLFDRVAGDTLGRDARFAERATIFSASPAPVPGRACGAATSALNDGPCAEARQSALFAAKDQAMRELLRTAGWQWAGAMLLGLLFVGASRRLKSPALGVALALAAWAVAAYVARVPWPLAGEQSFVPARASLELGGTPAPFVIGLLALAASVLTVALVLPGKSQRARPQAVASRIGYPGFVLATGVGFLLLLDLSANASHGNRYLALYHQGHLWLAMLALSVLVFLRQPIGRALAWSLSIVEGVGSAVGRRLGPVGSLRGAARARGAALRRLRCARSPTSGS